MKSPIPAELDPAFVVAVVDTREQLPFTAAELAPLQVVKDTLTTGDVSIFGLEQHITIELKHSLADLLTCIGADRPRFDRAMQRMRAYETRAVVCEFTWADLERGDWRGKITPAQATGSVLGWIASGVPFIFAGTRDSAAKATSRLLYIAARRRWREARALVAEVIGEKKLSRNAQDPATIASFDPTAPEVSFQ